MTNGNTGVADLLCGNWHMRQDWDYTMDSTSFIIRTPEDGASRVACAQQPGYLSDNRDKRVFETES